MTDHWEPYNPNVTRPYLRRSYPRLRDRESLLLRAYLEETGVESLENLRTAVPVGDGEVAGIPDTIAQEQKKALSMWKIDAVIDRPGRQEVVELKSRATHTAVGQALAYDQALGDRPNEPTTSTPTVVAFRAHPDLSKYARAVNVRLHTIPQADRSTGTRRFLEDREDLT